MKLKILQVIADNFGGLQPFVAGFGDKGSDVACYKGIGQKPKNIYFVNSSEKMVYRYDGKVKFTYELLEKYCNIIFPKRNRLEKNQEQIIEDRQTKRLTYKNDDNPDDENNKDERKEKFEYYFNFLIRFRTRNDEREKM